MHDPYPDHLNLLWVLIELQSGRTACSRDLLITITAECCVAGDISLEDILSFHNAYPAGNTDAIRREVFERADIMAFACKLHARHADGSREYEAILTLSIRLFEDHDVHPGLLGLLNQAVPRAINRILQERLRCPAKAYIA